MMEQELFNGYDIDLYLYAQNAGIAVIKLSPPPLRPTSMLPDFNWKAPDKNINSVSSLTKMRMKYLLNLSVAKRY